MQKILSYILSFLFYTALVFLLLLFHPIQMICLKIFGYNTYKTSVDVLNFILIKSLRILWIKAVFKTSVDLPADRPLIVVSNHQGTYDIPPIVWIFRKHHPKFIAKKELAKNIPSVSYHLRHSGSALIDRKNSKQAVPAIYRLGKLIAKNNHAACIFPEGTRNRSGEMRKFKSGGIEILLKASPNALIVPFVIDGNYQIEALGMFPLGICKKVSYRILNPIEPNGKSAKDLTEEVEKLIRNHLQRNHQN